MKKVILILSILLLTGCIDGDKNKGINENNQQLIFDDIEEVKYSYSFPLSEAFENFVYSNYTYEITEADEYIIVNYYTSDFTSSVIVFDSNLNELFRMENNRRYRVKPYLYKDYFVIDVSTQANGDWRLFDLTGTMVEDVTFFDVEMLYNGSEYQIFSTEYTESTNIFLELKKVTDDSEEVFFTYTNPGSYSNALYLEDETVIMIVDGIGGYKAYHINQDGSFHQLDVNSPRKAYPTDEGFLITTNNQVHSYNLQNQLQFTLEVEDFYGFEYTEYDTYMVFTYDEMYTRVDEQNNIEIFENNPYQEFDVINGKIVHELIKSDGQVRSLITGYIDVFESTSLDTLEYLRTDQLFQIELQEVEEIMLRDDFMYFVDKDENNLSYKKYKYNGEFVSSQILTNEVFDILDSGYIVNGCLNPASELNLCISMIDDNGMQLWQLDSQKVGYEVLPIDDQLFVLEAPLEVCDFIVSSWVPCTTIVFNKFGNILLNSENTYQDFRYFYHDHDYLYTRGIPQENELSFGGAMNYKVFVYDFEMNLIRQYEEIALSSDYTGIYYLTDDELVYIED